MIGEFDEIIVPDVAEPIVGWRAFRYQGTGQRLRLYSINLKEVWGLPKAPLFFKPCKARCAGYRVFAPYGDGIAAETHCRESPCPVHLVDRHDGRGCGIYSFKEPHFLMKEYGPARPRQNVTMRNPNGTMGVYSEPGLIWGKIESWGEVYDHDRGYRAEYAQVKSLCYMEGSAFTLAEMQAIADLYGVPLEVISANEVLEILTDTVKLQIEEQLEAVRRLVIDTTLITSIPPINIIDSFKYMYSKVKSLVCRRNHG